MPNTPRLNRLRMSLATSEVPAEASLLSVVLDIWALLDRVRTTEELRQHLSPSARVRLRVALDHGLQRGYFEQNGLGLWQRGSVEPSDHVELVLDQHFSVPPQEVSDTVPTTDQPTQKTPRKRGKRRYTHLTEQQEHDLIQAYAFTDQSILDIARSFGIHQTYPYRVLDKNGIGWRRENRQTFAEWAHAEGRANLIEEALHARLAELNVDTGFATPAPLQQVAATLVEEQQERPEPVRDAPVPDLPLDLKGPPVEWVIEITERFSVMANSIEGAVSEARKVRRHGRITGVRMRQIER